MTLRHLYYFIEVAEQLSISKAADSLMVAQPSVSQTIKELENYYNIELFIRDRKKISLTKEGNELLLKAKEIINSFEEFEAITKDITNHPKVRIGFTLTFGVRAIPLIIKYLKENIPNIDYYISVDNTSKIEDKLINGELDFAFIEGLPINKSLISNIFAHDWLYLVSGNEYDIPNKISFKELKDYDLLLREIGSNPRKYIDYILALNGIRLSPKMESISNLSLINMVKENLGVSILPRGVVEPYINNKVIRKVELDIELKRPLHAIYHKNKKLTPIQKKALNIISLYLKEFRDDD